MRGPVIILRAPPGCGKTTVSLALQTRLKPAFRLSIDTMRYFLQPRIRDSNQFWMAKVAALDCALQYASRGIPSILESVFEDRSTVEALMWRAERVGFRCLVFTLQASLETVISRNSARDIYYSQAEDRIRELYSKYDWTLGKLINTEGKITEEVAEDIEEWCERFSANPVKDRFRYVAFVRHGEVNRNPAVYDHEASIGLTAKGLAQSALIGRMMLPFVPDKVICSPFRRTRESAEQIAAASGVTIDVEERLREREFAALYGVSREVIVEKYSEQFAQQLAVNSDALSTNGSETLIQAQARVVEAIRDVIRSYSRAVIVSHGGPHSWLLSHLLGTPLEMHRSILLEPGCYSLLRFKEDGSFDKVIALNSSSFPSV